MTIKKIGGEPVVIPPPPPPPPQPASKESAPQAQAQASPIDSFQDASRPPVVLDPKTSEGRTAAGGTADDSIGRGTADDSIGRNGGTPDDSIGSDQERVRQTLGEVPTWLQNRQPINHEGLSEATNEQINALLGDEGKVAAAAYAFSTEAFSAMSAEERTKFVNVMSKVDQDGARVLARVAERAGDALFEVATDGTTTLDSLQRLADDPKGATFLNPLLRDIANPDRIMQGQAPTCTAASMQYGLAKERPAEYARLITGLALEGSVRMAGGGTLVDNAAQSLSVSMFSHDDRSPTEAVFQNAAMEFANGKDEYDEAAGRSQRADGTSYRGLYPGQIRGMVGELFGTNYQTVEIRSDEEAAGLLSRMPAEFKPNQPVFFDIDFGKFNHNVAFEGIRDGMVLYHDPYTGKHEQMPTDEFIRRATSVHLSGPAVVDKELDRLRSFVRVARRGVMIE